MRYLSTKESIEDLLKADPYSMSREEREPRLMDIIRDGVVRAQVNPHVRSMYTKLEVDPRALSFLNDVPTVPVRMFKTFDLSTCDPKEINRVLRSSGTTSHVPSQVPLNKTTAANQTKALKSILGSYLGERRRTMLVIDHPGINRSSRELSARGAGVRGLAIYAKDTIYLLKEENGVLGLDQDAVSRVAHLSPENDVYIFGFTFIIWSVFCEEMERAGLRLELPNAVVFHGGGWKRLRDLKISRDAFSGRLSRTIGCERSKIHDFYGMAEQTGIIFVDCEHGHKHVPVFGHVIVRDIQTMDECPVGKRGLIEVMSILGDSYYCQAILTEDVGVLIGEDDCPCGRKGRYFSVEGRVERAEPRGCGDTFQER